MQITLETNHDQELLENAYADTYGYREQVPNPVAKPAAVLKDEEYSDPESDEVKVRQIVENQADIDAWQEYIPNPVTKAEFTRTVMLQRVDEVVSGYQARQAKNADNQKS